MGSTRIGKLFAVAVAVLVGFCSGQTFAGPRYYVTNLQTLGSSSSRAFGLNDFDQVAGQVDDGSGFPQACLWQAGSMQSLHWNTNWPYSFAWDVNNQGMVTGSAKTPPNTIGRLWNPATHSVTTLGFLPGGTGSFSWAINEDNVAVGHSDDTWLVYYHTPVYWDTDHVIHALPTLGGREGIIRDINNHSVMVGWAFNAAGSTRACLWQGSSPVDLLPGMGDGRAQGINDAGQVVGFIENDNGDTRAFLYDPTHPVRDLGALSGDDSKAFALNEDGLVVGEAEIDNGDLHAFLYADNRMLDLNDLIPTDSAWVLARANDINIHGHICGWGTINGETHAFLLTPIPEPTTMLLLGTGLLGVIGFLRRRRGN